MTTSVTDHLVQEVRDLLEVSSVGLYEFTWILRSLFPDSADEELRSWASDALAQLMTSHDGHLVLLEWPSEDVIGAGPETPPGPSSDVWGEPQDGRSYIAIIRN